MTGRLREVAWLGQNLAKVDDAALQRVVSLLDGLRERGEADRVLDQARRRLRALRPPRPLGFARILFLPFDGAITPSARWRRGEALLPRGALAALAAAVQAGLGANAAPILQACEGRTTADAGAIAQIGALLWPAATLPPEAPPDWALTGLPTSDYQAIAALCRPVWAAGPALWAALSAATEGPPEELVRAALGGLAGAGPQPFAVALAALIARAAAPGRVAEVAAGLGPALRGAALQALEAALDQPLPEFDRLDPGCATQAARDLTRRLDDLAACPLLTSDRQRRLQMLRRAAEEACREAFLAAAEQQLLAPAARLAEAPEVADQEVAALEAEARGLRLLQAAGRGLGGAGAYDRALCAMVEGLTLLGGRASHPAGLQRMDLARAIELLAGPEAAAAVLAEPG
ncbi:hypothetical protein [Siccirubricoccus sp. G192]|uniref:hypothetical protein n=1 Tax=Siccirubricoccus sp. G192 TaxID=2849651 RepID=UPI001C2BC8DE|nr:hypothetical protein [Siccirubricoccus sp. G192]MBV1795767.1 hypothetical protein [Siccirubricoccus sp. G192]